MYFKRLIFLPICCALFLSVAAQSRNADYEAYIRQYHKEAQKQQKKYNIPASITLAQGLLESGAGKSELATKANNHFGVKCAGDWNGDTYKHDDETKNECFRKYRHAEQSYEDHSLFLQKKRYQPLFELPITDYKGWAHGLRQCGYATDPGYAAKLIKLIEDYDLTQYDLPNASGEAKVITDKTADSSDASSDSVSSAAGSSSSASSSQATDKEEKAAYIATDADLSAASPAKEARAERRQMGSVALNQTHKVLRNNGRKYVVARLGDTFADIAYEFNLYEKTLRQYNDIVNPRYELQEGDKVYLQRKRKKAEKRFAHYRVQGDENIWQIAQDKGMRLSTIYRLNGIETGQNVMRNQDLLLR